MGDVDMRAERKAPWTRGLVPMAGSRLGERLARTAGTFCRRADGAVFGGSMWRGLGFGGGAPARVESRTVDPYRAARGDASTFSATPPVLAAPRPCSEFLEEDGCKGEFDRTGEHTRGTLELAGTDLTSWLATEVRGCSGADALPAENLWLHAPRLGEAPFLGDCRKPIPAARSPAGDCDRRLPALEFDCADEERSTPQECRQVRGAAERLLQPPVLPSPDPAPSSSSNRSWCWSCSVVACIWLLISEN